MAKTCHDLRCEYVSELRFKMNTFDLANLLLQPPNVCSPIFSFSILKNKWFLFSFRKSIIPCTIHFNQKKKPSENQAGLSLLITDTKVSFSRLFIDTLLFLDTFHFTTFLFVVSNLFKNVYIFCLRIFWSR